VPPEVAAPHPTADEVARLNAALKRIAETDTSPDGPLLKKYESLLTVPPSRPNPCIAPVPRNAQRHAEFVKIAEKGDIDLLLEGDSITDWWINPPPRPAPGEAANPAEVPVGKPTAAYTKYFGNIKTADFAIAGDTTQGVLWGLQNGEGKGFQPKAIMLMIGTNNMGTCSAAEIAEGVGAIVLENRKDFPNAKILLLAIFPRSVPTDPVRTKIAETNQIISKLNDGQHVFYMDIGSKFLDERGYFLPDAFRGDNLHPQEKGYDIWGAAVIDKLKEFLK
jgi:lysophospholipase L1-like esterase